MQEKARKDAQFEKSRGIDPVYGVVGVVLWEEGQPKSKALVMGREHNHGARLRPYGIHVHPTAIMAIITDMRRSPQMCCGWPTYPLLSWGEDSHGSRAECVPSALVFITSLSFFFSGTRAPEDAIAGAW
eukprot:3677168-Ditylum_brightwellii.AAC.1